MRKRGEYAAFVFEQYRAAGSHFRRQSVVRAEIGFDGLVLVRLALEREPYHTQSDFVEVFFGKRAFLDRLDDVFVVCAAVAGHFEVHTRLDAFDPVVHRAPVADDNAAEAPFPAEHVGEHTLVVRKISAVQAVVGAHHRGGLFRLDDVFESGEINFAQSTFVHYGVNAHTEMFLVVCAEMFDRHSDAVFLHAVHPRRAHSARDVRVFGKIFEIPAAQGRALDVDAGSEYGGDAERFRFGGDCGSDLFEKIGSQVLAEVTAGGKQVAG